MYFSSSYGTIYNIYIRMRIFIYHSVGFLHCPSQQQGQCEGRRFARPRLRRTQQVYTLQDGRNGARLNGRGRHKARLGGSVDKGGGETEGSKRHGKALERR